MTNKKIKDLCYIAIICFVSMLLSMMKLCISSVFSSLLILLGILLMLLVVLGTVLEIIDVISNISKLKN